MLGFEPDRPAAPYRTPS